MNCLNSKLPHDWKTYTKYYIRENKNNEIRINKLLINPNVSLIQIFKELESKSLNREKILFKYISKYEALYQIMDMTEILDRKPLDNCYICSNPNLSLILAFCDKYNGDNLNNSRF